MTDDVATRLREQADRAWPEAWKPVQPGDEIVGTVIAIRASVATAYGNVPVIELEELSTGRPAAVWLIHTVLRREFARAKPTPGETVLVRFKGRVQPTGGGPIYADYKVVVDRLDQAADVDWNAIAAHEQSDDLAVAREAPYDPGTAPFPEDF